MSVDDAPPCSIDIDELSRAVPRIKQGLISTDMARSAVVEGPMLFQDEMALTENDRVASESDAHESELALAHMVWVKVWVVLCHMAPSFSTDEAPHIGVHWGVDFHGWFVLSVMSFDQSCWASVVLVSVEVVVSEVPVFTTITTTLSAFFFLIEEGSHQCLQVVSARLWWWSYSRRDRLAAQQDKNADVKDEYTNYLYPLISNLSFVFSPIGGVVMLRYGFRATAYLTVVTFLLFCGSFMLPSLPAQNLTFVLMAATNGFFGCIQFGYIMTCFPREVYGMLSGMAALMVFFYCLLSYALTPLAQYGFGGNNNYVFLILLCTTVIA
ncbi:hypothetical protein AeRB84_012869 [Aphanomyces euteiches]|nr:hypothetical protein AeRB84_012869 [Aphanomyces euteiches]